MKKFAFSLERLLVFQEENLEKEKEILGRLTAEKNKLDALKMELEAKNVRIREEMGRQELAGTTIFILKAYSSVLESGRSRQKEVEAELALQTSKIERQRQVVTAASQEVKKLEKLKEKQLEEYHYEEAKEQQNVIIEHVAEDFVRRGDSI